MNSCKGLLLGLLLVTLAYGQTNFNTTCQNDSMIPLLATGTINLNPLDTYNNGANKDYTQDLALAKFQPVDVLGYAFALSGFQTNCGQSYYTLIVDKVIFENQNTRMRIVVNFRNTNDGSITKWTMVTFTYIVVSRNLNGAYSDIWASTASTTLTTTITLPIDTLGAEYQPPASTTSDCRTYVDPGLTFDSTNCDGTTATSAAAAAGGSMIVHAYVMGFQWNSNKSTTNFLAASVFNTAGGLATPPGSAPATAEEGANFLIVHATSPSGPTITLDFFNGAMEFIKIGFVFSRYDKLLAVAPLAANPDLSVFPTGSFLKYTSSYIYEKVTKFNTTVPLIRGAAANPTYTYNQKYWRLPDARYAIYGLTGFSLPKTTTTTCGTQIWINATLNSINSYSLYTPNQSPTNFYFSADIFTVRNDALCASADPLVTPTFTDITTVGKKSYFTVPTQSLEQFIQEHAAYPLDAAAGTANIFEVSAPAATATRWPNLLFHQYYGAKNGNNDTILFRAEIPYTGLTVGAPIMIEFGYGDPLNPIGVPQAGAPLANTIGMKLAVNYTVELKVNGFVLYQNVYTGKAMSTNLVNQIMKGINVQSTVANVVITISYPRAIDVDQNLFTYIILSQFAKAYDPATGCCVAACPASTGLDVVLTPPTCVACDTRAGLFYNPNNGTCTCLPGYYLDATKTFQCYPCSALYCSICNPLNPAQCTTCATGATLNFNYTCTCGDGFFVNGTVCQQCPIACQTCTTNGICLTCVDTQHRDINQGCNCITGFYHSGSVNCTACSGTCRTCTNGSACTSCDAAKFRSLNGGVCTCMAGYYEMYNDDQSRTCQKCNPECLTCAISPTSCTSCDPKKNRLQGMDDFGHQTCLCQPGFFSTPDGSCVQSNCNADPFCAQCEQGLKLCVQCLASKNRIIKLPESICVCMDGYYADASNNCVPCTAGCGVCKSATNCSSCVALATPSTNGGCACPAKTYFTISPDGVRYCAACGPYCNVCVNSTTCTTCLPSFTKTVDNQCVCSAKNFIDSKNNCVPCASGCQTCTSNANCSKCIDPLVLQGTVCQANCFDGYTALGSVCIGCPTGCLQCTQNFICFYCADGLYMYNGKCYDICPAGTIGDSTGGNWNCVPCNSPCKTCMNHPSYCTSCENGKGYLQTSAVQQSCVEVCNDGTFAQGGVCQVCDFKCATCLGSATNCISCPANQVLYKGGCWAACPAILLSDNKIPGTAGSCVDNCPDGFYKASDTECVPCSIQCTTCNGGPDNCTSCLHGSVSTNGTCTVKCGENQFSFQGICVACSPSCYGCQYSPQNCLECAAGYVRSGSICQKGCLSQQYFDAGQQKCINCDSKCGSCSSFSYCLTCANPAINPRGGICSSCPYPCATCDGTGACTSCLSGFYFFQGRCQTTCPAGAAPVNGICRCNSGIVSNGKCVASCASGFTSLGGSCVPCNSNCAECAGSVNSCTKCLSGFSIDANSQRCVSSTQCPYGQEANNGRCESICDTGFFYYEGICIYGSCFAGYADNGFGGCTRKTGADAASPAANCNPGQFVLKGRCVSDCGSGFYPDPASTKCLPCSANCLACFNANFCVSCQNGFASNSGVCSASTSCDGTQYQYGAACVNACPIGTFVQGSQCQRSCPDNTFYQSQICYINCPGGLRTADACVTSCPAGTSNRNGVCA